MAGTSNYPGALDDFAEASPTNLGDDDSTGRNHSERHDDVEAAMEAVQGELGVDPAGPSASTVAARFTALDSSVTGKASASISITAGNGLSGGGDLSANRTVSASFSATNPVVNGTAAPGSANALSRGDHVHPTDTTRAPLASPTFTGTPAAPTASVDTNTTQVATTAFVVGQAASVNPAALGAAASGTSSRYSRQDHVHPTTGLGLTSGKLSQFASTTSAELAGIVSDETGTGALVFGTSPTLSQPAINNPRFGYTTTATSAGTLTLTDTSSHLQYFTGTTTHTLVLPVTSTLALGQTYAVRNDSTGAVTVQSSGLNAIVTVAAAMSVEVTCVLTSGTTAASWSIEHTGSNAITGTGSNVFSVSPTFTGTPAAPTASADTNTTQIATTAFVTTADNLKANLASPTFTGTPAAPTASVSTNTTQVATTAFVVGQAASAAPIIEGVATVGTSSRFAREDHIHPTGGSGATTPLSGAVPASLGTGAAGTSASASRGDHVHPTTGVVLNALVTAKGDLIVATGNATPARLAVGGTNGHALKINSATATGLEWGAVTTTGEDDQIVLAVQVFG